MAVGTVVLVFCLSADTVRSLVFGPLFTQLDMTCVLASYLYQSRQSQH
jgi:hypothetical protein